MRTCTLAFSVFVHLLIVSAAILVPIVTTDATPIPRRAMAFVAVRPVPTSTVPPPPGRGRRASSDASPAAAPVEPPTGLQPETEFEQLGIGASDHGVPGGIPGGDPDAIVAIEPPPPPPPPRPAPVRPGGSIRAPRKVRDVAPVYPPLALAARKEGLVVLEAEIGEDGRVRHVRVLRSVTLLDEAAIDAVRDWEFTPTLLNGQPVPIVMTVTVAFTLRR